MQARDVMTTNVMTVTPDTSVPEIAQLLIKHRISAVPVIDAAGRLVGIVSEGDLIHQGETGEGRRRSWWLHWLGDDQAAVDYVKSHGVRASDVMTRTVVTASEDADLHDIARLLEERRIKRVPIVRDGRLIGVVSRADLIRGLAVRKPVPEQAATSDDRAIRERFLQSLKEEDWASPRSLNIIVRDGIIHLWGFVHSDAERDALRVAAETTEGARGVDNHLAIAPPVMGPD
jgi:CBS domain-containing protein